MTTEPVGQRLDRTEPRARPLIPVLPARLRSWLPPIDDGRFWVVQVLVVLVAILHSWVEYQEVLDHHSAIYLLPATLFLIPVLYAAVTFGRRGAVLTAMWAAVLVLPNVLLLHDPLAGVGEVAQIAWITIVAAFVGGRVERERSARREAEFREQRQRESEERYRAIVNNVGEPIVVLDADERVIEANDSATALFGQGDVSIRGSRLQGGAGDALRALLEQEDGERPRPRIRLGQTRWYEPIVFRSADAEGASTTQVLLVDVTRSTEREQGLESITRRTIATREEERRHISRELHDGPLQSLVALWRDLDRMTSAVMDPLRAELLRARGATEDVADQLRRFSRDLRPSILDDLGIAAALRAEAERIRTESNIDVRTEMVGAPRRLGIDREITLLRIAQEALRNVVRHSGASIARVTLDFGPPDTRMQIADDGAGLDPIPAPSELLRGSHLGMIGMQERARMIGGSVLFRRAALGGLEVVVEIRDGDRPDVRDESDHSTESEPDP